MYSYRKTAGVAHDLMVRGEDYTPAPGEFVTPGDEEGRMPPIRTLHDRGAVYPEKLQEARTDALRVMHEESLAARALMPDAPPEVLEYVRLKSS